FGLGLGLGLGIGLLLATLAGQVALLLAVLLEVRLVPAASRQAELRSGELAADLVLATLRALHRIGIGKLLQAVELVATGGTLESVNGHGARDVPGNCRRYGGGAGRIKPGKGTSRGVARRVARLPGPVSLPARE